MVEFQMKAEHCATINIQGGQEGFGHALNAKDSGFMGLKGELI